MKMFKLLIFSTILACPLLALQHNLSLNHHGVMALDGNNKLWAWGKNTCARLGLGHYKAALTPTKAFFHDNSKTTAYDFSNATFTTSLNQKGSLWLWGTLFGFDYLTSSIPMEITFPENVKISEVVTHKEYFFAIDDNGGLWTLGKNYCGELGIGTIESIDKPIKVDFKEEVAIKEIFPYDHVTLAIDTNGNLWGWGSNAYGRLGFQSNISSNRFRLSDQLFPQKFSFPKNTFIEKAYQDDLKFYALDSKKRLWFWGITSLEDESIENTIKSPYPLNFSHEIKEVFPRENQDLLLLDIEGSLWQWSLKQKEAPQKVSYFNNKVISEVFRQPEFTFVLSEDGQLYSWGQNNYGQLGLGDKDFHLEPALVSFDEDVRITQTFLGIDHAVALDSDGALWAWGKNSNGELGIKSDIDTDAPKRVILPKGIKITNFMIKNHNFFAVDESGYLWSWGRNLYGETGAGYQGVVKSPVRLRICLKNT